MKIVLIHPLYRHIYEKIRGLRYLDPPIGLLYIAAALRRAGNTVTVIDAEAEGAPDAAAVADMARRAVPDLVGLSFTTPMLSSAAATTASLKKALPRVPVMVGGPHPTAEPQTTIEATGADFAVIGEGEETAVDLAARLSAGRSLDGCPGIRRACAPPDAPAPRRPFIRDIDALPFPARDLLRVGLYTHPFSIVRRRHPYYTNILSSRGCPFRCIFCGSAAVFGSTIRFRAPARVVDEIEECMRRLDIGIFGFADDTLTVREGHILGICEEIRRRGLDPSWIAQARVDTVDEKILRAMKGAGCREVSFGYESGSEAVLKAIKKGITVEQSLRATRLAKEAGLKIHGYFMIGNPGETEASVEQTIALARKLDPDTAQFTLAQPFPGTEFHAIAAATAPLRDAYSSFKWYENASYTPEGMDRTTLLALHRRAFRTFYFRPRRVLRAMLDLRSRRNWKPLLDGIRSFLNVTRRAGA